MNLTDESNRTTVITQLPDWKEAALIAMQMYYIPVLVSLGTLGNCLSVYVFCGTKMRRASSSWYLSALAISDTGFLLSIFVTWLNLFEIGIFNRPGYCQFFVYLPTLCSFLSVWFVVSFTVERFVAVRYPLRRQSMCTVTRAKTTLLGLTIVGLIVCSPVLWFAAPRPIPNKPNMILCLLAGGWENWAHAFNIADTIFTFVLPFTIIAILNGRIVKTVWGLARIRRNLTTDSRKCRTVHQSRGTTGPPQSKITKMLLVVSTFFLCFNLPAYVMRVRAFLEENEEPPRSIIIAQHVCNLLFDTNFGINFVLYCASGENFRKAVVAMFLRRRPSRWQSRTPTTNYGNKFAPEMKKCPKNDSTIQKTTTSDVPWSECCELREIANRNSQKFESQSSSGKQ